MATINLAPTPKQDLAWQILNDKETNYLFFGGGAGGGKTWFGCEFFITLCYLYPGIKLYIGREELKRLMGSTYVTFLKVASHHKVPQSDWHLNGQYNYIEFKNGSRIDLLDLKFQPSDPLYQRFGSLEYTLGWNEEAQETHFMSFDVLKTRVGRHMNKEFGLLPKILLTGNPDKTWPYRLFYKPWKEGTLNPQYKFLQSLYTDNPHTAEEYGKQLATITDPATKQRLMFGNWEYDADPATMIKFEAIIDLFTNTVEESKEKYIVADIARYGSDKTVITIWQGLECIRVITLEKLGVDSVADRIKILAKDYLIPYSHIAVDEDGVGGGVVDILRGIRGFQANTTPVPAKNTGKPDNYQNLKAQCTYLLAEMINNHKIAVRIDDTRTREMLIEELEQIKTKDADKDGKLKIIGKDEIKEMIGRSPDYSDCLMMRMYFELQKATTTITYQQPAYRPLSQYEGGETPKPDTSYLDGIKVIYNP